MSKKDNYELLKRLLEECYNTDFDGSFETINKLHIKYDVPVRFIRDIFSILGGKI